MSGDEAPAPPPAPVIISPPQSITQTASETADAQVAAFEKLIPLLPQYAQTLTDIQSAQAPQISEINIQQQQKYGPQLTRLALDNLKMADPTGLSAREHLGKRVLSGLMDENFGKLSAGETRQAEQDIRAAQIARGGGTALSDSIEEAISKYNLGTQTQQRQLANVGSFLAGTPPQASFGSLNQAGQTAPVGTQNVQGFASGLFPSTNQLISNQAQNYGTMANFTTGLNSANLQRSQFNEEYSSNPFVTGLTVASNVAGNIMGGMAMCWVAEELYSKDHPKTHAIRAFVRRHIMDQSWLGDFCRQYLEKGREWAENIKKDSTARKQAWFLWESLYDMALQEGV